MRGIRKVVSLVFLLTFIFLLLAGCYDRREVDDLAYVIAIGLDNGKTNKLKMTLQIAVPKAIGGEGAEGGKDAVTIITVETPTLFSGLNMANNTISRQLNISHAKLMVFSKELAEKGISDLITALPRGREMRPSIQIAVSKGPAEEFLKSVTPKLEFNPAKYYELAFQSYKHTGFTAPTDFYDFYTRLKSLYAEPSAILAGVSKYKTTDEFSLEDSTALEKGREQPLEGDFKAGSIPKVGELEAEIMGLAIFKGGKMVGELDGEETVFHNIVMGNYNRSYTTLRDPLESDKFIILDVKQSRSPHHKVNIKNGKPEIDVMVSLEADIQVIQSGRNYEDSKNVHILEKAYEEYFRDGISRMLYKTSKEFGSDICGFGEHIKAKFLTWAEWENYGWPYKYKDSNFIINVDFKIRRPGLMVRSSPTEE